MYEPTLYYADGTAPRITHGLFVLQMGNSLFGHSGITGGFSSGNYSISGAFRQPERTFLSVLSQFLCYQISVAPQLITGEINILIPKYAVSAKSNMDIVKELGIAL